MENEIKKKNKRDQITKVRNTYDCFMQLQNNDGNVQYFEVLNRNAYNYIGIYRSQEIIQIIIFYSNNSNWTIFLCSFYYNDLNIACIIFEI